MKPCPCKDCISYAICNSKFKDIKYLYEAQYIARSLIDKCSIIRNHLTKFNKISDSEYDFDDSIVVTVDIKSFINTFIDESILSQSISHLLTLKLIYDSNNMYKEMMVNMP